WAFKLARVRWWRARNTWNRMYGVEFLLSRYLYDLLESNADGKFAAESLCLYSSPKTLFQCLQFLRPKQARARPLSLAAQAVVSPTRTHDCHITSSKWSNLPTAIHFNIPSAAR